METNASSLSLPGGLERATRRLLDRLHRLPAGPFGPRDAAGATGLLLGRARRLLPYLAARGWLSRVRRGLYITVPLDAREPSDWREDPWVVASRVFAPCYIGGWSACEHWGLTDQLFGSVVVISAATVRSRNPIIQGTPFRVKVVAGSKLFGTRTVWRRGVRVRVADPSRALVDCLGEPALGGGIRHVADMLRVYFESEHRGDSLLLAYAERAGNRSIFKRLGFLVEHLQIAAPEILAMCARRKSAGIVLLDPTLPKRGKFTRRWGLRINATIKPNGT